MPYTNLPARLAAKLRGIHAAPMLPEPDGPPRLGTETLDALAPLLVDIARSGAMRDAEAALPNHGASDGLDEEYHP